MRAPADVSRLSFRPRADGDLSILADLWVSAWQKAMPQIDFAARRDWFLDHLLKLEAAGFATVCAADAQVLILGFAALNPLTQELDQLAVAAPAWGSGVAAALLAEARRLSPQGLFLDVNQDNARAVRFYEREGFWRIAEGVNAASGPENLADEMAASGGRLSSRMRL